MNPKISIIIPVYNVEEYLVKCLDSVVNQTLKDIEIICIDDFSTDNSLKILEEYAQKDSRIIIIKQEKNQGVSCARNVGINNASGEYIMFIDSDDYYELNACEDAYNCIISKDGDICKFGYNIQIENKLVEHPKNKLIKDILNGTIAPNFVDFAGNTWSKIYKKSFLVENKISFPESLIMAEDTWFDIQCLYQNAKICYLDKVLYNYYFDRIGSATFGNKNGMKHDIDTYEYVKKQPLFINQNIENQLKFINILFCGGFYFYAKVSEKKDKQIVQRDIIKFIEIVEKDYNKDDLEKYCSRYLKIKKKFMPKVSIIIPVYNVEEYLVKCLDSVVNQTLKDIEIICIDDCSTDNSLKILEEYAQEDSRIIILKQEENQGQGVARNKGLDIVKGQYIMFLDPDDWFDIHACEIAYNQIQRNNNELVFFNVESYNQKDKSYTTGKNRISIFEKCINNEKISLFEIKEPFIQTCEVWYKIYKTKYINQNNIRFSDGRFGEDGIFSLKAMLLSKSVSVIDLALYKNRKHSSSTVATGVSLFGNYIEEKHNNLDFILSLPEWKRNKAIYSFVPYYIRSLTFYYKKYIKSNPENKKNLYETVKKEFIFLQEKYPEFIQKTEKYYKYKFFKKVLMYSYEKYIFLEILQKIFSITNKGKRKVIKIGAMKIEIKRGKKFGKSKI